MFRKVFDKLLKWKNSKKALLVTGARQVGKTYIIREFLRREYGDDYVELNLLENDLAKQALENITSSEDLILRISAISKKELRENRTVIFLDEIQVCSNVITAIKFLVEKTKFKYIMSGSLLGTELTDIRSIPVGYMEVINMYPLDFEEFLIANGLNEKVLQYLADRFENCEKVDDVIHTSLISLFQMYLIIGGMPAVVQKYLDTKNIKTVVEEQFNINQLYKLDISKYDKENKLLINEIYDLIPSELNNQNKRFILKDLNENLKFKRYENSFLWLKNAGVALPCYCADEAKIPLKLSKSSNLFKLYHCDVGLLSCMYMDENLQIKILNNETDINFGAIYENAVAQELVSKGFDLYYYRNKKNGEVDFLIEYRGWVVPLEIKSGKNYKRHNALDHLLNNCNIEMAYVFSNKNVEKTDKEIYMPIYMIMFLKRELVKDSIYSINISKINSRV